MGVTVFNFFILPKISLETFHSRFQSFTFTSIAYIFLASLLFTITAFLGGMLISVLKRRKGLKDVGNVLPGHGGFLDRFDSVFFTALLTWLFIQTIF